MNAYSGPMQAYGQQNRLFLGIDYSDSLSYVNSLKGSHKSIQP